jgi:3-isopropylmalate/(R)-2-methylmalate dehydratase large subunit
VTPRDIGFSILEQFGQQTDYFAQNNTIEYGGDCIRNMSLDGRQTLCNMATEMGATNSFIEPDDRLKREYLKPKVDLPYEISTSDPSVDFYERHTIEVDNLGPKVAYPYSPANVHDIEDAEGIEIDQFFLGSCANGHLKDLRLAADTLQENEIPDDVDLIVTPATDEIRKQASKEGILDVFFQSGARVSSNYCSVCAGYEGVLAAGEKCLSTNTRNYKGRMGHKDSKTYLCSPATLAASAINGKITDPRSYME